MSELLRPSLRALAQWRKDRALQARYRTLLGKVDGRLALGDATIEVTESATGFAIDVLQAVDTFGECEGGVLGLDLTGSPFMFDGPQLTIEAPAYQEGQGVFLGPLGAAAWQKAEVNYRFAWNPKDATDPSVIFVPTNLLTTGFVPWGGWTTTARQAPRLRIVIDERADVRIAGVRSDLSSGQPGTYCSGAIFQDAATICVDGAESATCWLSGGLAERLGSDGVQQYRGAISAALGGLRDLFDSVPFDALFVCDDDRVFAPLDLLRPVVEIDARWLAQYRQDSAELRFELIRELVAMYWGGGCQLVGPTAFETRNALGAAVALTWASTESPSMYAEKLAAYRWLGAANRLGGILRGNLRDGRTARLALRVHESLVGSGSGGRLQAATRTYWGMQTLPDTVLSTGFGLERE